MSVKKQIHRTGRHQAWLEEPDAIFMVLDGNVTGQDILDFLMLVEHLGDGTGPVFLIQDLRKTGTFTADARKTITEDPRTKRFILIISVGASFQMRVILTMVSKVYELLNRKMVPTRFAENEEEARKILATERARLGNS